MILKLLKSNRKSGYLLLPLFILCTGAVALFLPGKLEFNENQPGAGLLGFYSLFSNEVIRILSFFLLLLTNGLLVNRINREYVFTFNKSVFPAILFVLLVIAVPGFSLCFPVWISISFLLIAIEYLFVSFDLRKPYGNLFNAGFFLGLGSCFYSDLIVLLPAFMIGSWFLARDAHWRESAVSLLGALVPIVLVTSFYFLTDKTDFMIQILMGNLKTGETLVFGDFPLLMYFGFLGSFTLAGSYRMIQTYDEKKINFRKYFVVFFMFFLSIIISFILIPPVAAGIFIVAAVPVSFLISNFFDSFRRTMIGEIIFILFLSMAIYFQFV